MNVGQILEHDLLLQRDSGGRDHQGFAQMFGNRNGRQTVCHRLAGTGAGLDDRDRRVAVPMAVVIQLDAAKQLGHLGNHHSLAVARLERFVFEKGAVGRLNLAFEFIVQHAGSGLAGDDNIEPSGNRLPSGLHPPATRSSLRQIICRPPEEPHDGYPQRHTAEHS